MSYDPYQAQARAASTTETKTVDAGLQAHMRSVYNTMSIGLVVTGLTAYAGANVAPVANLVLYSPLSIVFAFAPLAFILLGFTPGRVARWPAAKLRSLFFSFCVLMGLSMTYIFVAFSGESVARVFFITAATFASMSLYGYTTKRDLSGVGNFLIMGLWGLILASIVNLFMQSAAVQFVTSAIGVLIFTGLTAWETQRLKESYAYNRGMAEANAKLAVLGALGLYLSFINLFQYLLHFMGSRE